MVDYCFQKHVEGVWREFRGILWRECGGRFFVLMYEKSKLSLIKVNIKMEVGGGGEIPSD